jgi:hypothetical protein
MCRRCAAHPLRCGARPAAGHLRCSRRFCTPNWPASRSPHADRLVGYCHPLFRPVTNQFSARTALGVSVPAGPRPPPRPPQPCAWRAAHCGRWRSMLAAWVSVWAGVRCGAAFQEARCCSWAAPASLARVAAVITFQFPVSSGCNSWDLQATLAGSSCKALHRPHPIPPHPTSRHRRRRLAPRPGVRAGRSTRRGRGGGAWPEGAGHERSGAAGGGTRTHPGRCGVGREV